MYEDHNKENKEFILAVDNNDDDAYVDGDDEN
jgi:hypothetical protein